MIEDLVAAMEAAIGEVDRWPDRRVQILHHNDADGLSSGAILTRAFERRGFESQRVCLEKPYPAVLEKIFDAEGRLILSDGISYAVEQGATHLVDIATLTGTVRRALGDRHVGTFASDDKFFDLLQAASKRTGESFWRLPIDEEYARGIKSSLVADLNETEGQRVADLYGIPHVYGDFRALLARDDIDAVHISPADHWHVPIAIAALRSGADVYCEKPLTLTIDEGKALSCPLTGKCLKQSLTLPLIWLTSRCRTGEITRQKGHSKSAYSTTVTGAWAGPMHWAFEVSMLTVSRG